MSAPRSPGPPGYLSLTEADRDAMLAAIEVSSIDELFEQIPEGVRLGRALQVPEALPEAVLARILRERELSPDVAPFAEGSAAIALSLAQEDSLRERQEFAGQIRAAIEARDLAPGVRFAEAQKGDRDTLKSQLGFFAQSLAVSAKDFVTSQPEQAERAARRHAAVLATISDIERNVQSALALEAMMAKLRRV